MQAVPAQQTWYQKAFVRGFRVFFVTLLFTMLGMGLGLFCGILWFSISGAIHNAHPDLSLAYRVVAIRVAVASGSIALLYQLLFEKRTPPRPRS